MTALITQIIETINPINIINLPMLLMVGIVLGFIGLAFTSYRFVIGYFFAGMLYWLWVEGLHWVVGEVAPTLVVSDSYVLAVAISLLPFLWLLRLPRHYVAPQDTLPNLQITAGQRRFVLEKDTDFYQHCIRHSAISEK